MCRGGGRGAGRGRCSRSPPTWARSLGAGPKLPPEPPTCPRCHGNDSAHVDEEEREERRGEARRHHDRLPRTRTGGGPHPQAGRAPGPVQRGPVPTLSACLPLLVPSADDLGCRCGSAPPPLQGVLGKWALRLPQDPPPGPLGKLGLVPGAEGIRARPTSAFSHYFSKGK